MMRIQRDDAPLSNPPTCHLCGAAQPRVAVFTAFLRVFAAFIPVCSLPFPMCSLPFFLHPLPFSAANSARCLQVMADYLKACR